MKQLITAASLHRCIKTTKGILLVLSQEVVLANMEKARTIGVRALTDFNVMVRRRLNHLFLDPFSVQNKAAFLPLSLSINLDICTIERKVVNISKRMDDTTRPSM